MAADDVASEVGRIAVGPPVNGTVEIGGPEEFRVDELVRRRLAALKDPREVIADAEARYSGAKLSLRTLVPEKTARLGETRFETWLTQSAAQTGSKGKLIYDAPKTNCGAGISRKRRARGPRAYLKYRIGGRSHKLAAFRATLTSGSTARSAVISPAGGSFRLKMARAQLCS